MKRLVHLDGLRGWAIALVLIFHLGTVGMASPLTLPGGYLGVEMFLVLSGYLLAMGFTRKEVKLKDFVCKKILRILFPVSVAALLALFMCLLSMDSEDLHKSARTATAAVCGYANIQLAESSSGYFSENVSFNPLLHMWYVAITLQLYIWGYVLYCIVKRMSKPLMIGTLSLIGVLSIVWCYCSEIRTSVTDSLNLPMWVAAEANMYYSTIARLWEPLVGAAVLLLPACNKKWLNDVLSLLAIIAIAYSVTENTDYAMPTVALSTALLIHFVPDSHLKKVLDNTVCQKLGTLSFSLYLVHMPIFVCYKCYTMTLWTYTDVCILLVCGLASALFFYKYVEKAKVTIVFFLIIWVLALGAWITARSTNGFAKQWNAESNSIELPKYRGWKEETNEKLYTGLDKNILVPNEGFMTFTRGGGRIKDRWLLRVGNPDAVPGFVIIGDSHGQHLFPGMDHVCKKQNIAGVYLTSIFIPLWDRSIKRARNYFCNREKVMALLNWLSQQPDIKVVIISYFWRHNQEMSTNWDGKKVPSSMADNIAALREFCLQLQAINKQPVYLAPIPEFTQISKPLRYVRHLHRVKPEKGLSTYEGCVLPESVFWNRNYELIKNLRQLDAEGVCKVLYPHRALVKDGVARIIKDKEILYRDDNHITASASIIVAESLIAEIKALLSEKN